jgi:dihydrodipicolinate synthase/N-acetylneuraminate lyase
MLRRGVAIPAHPLALTAGRALDERRQRALSRYYLAAGAGGLAVGVHTTQFRIHDPQLGLLQPVLELAASEMDRFEANGERSLVRVAGICGETQQAVQEAALARSLGYEFGLVNLAALQHKRVDQLLEHCRSIGETIRLFGFYLQPSVGGIALPFEFWQGFCEIDSAVAIKIAAFDRYRTIDVVRAVAESGREDIALYTGNDDNIVLDLVTPYDFGVAQGRVTRRFVGGLLGHWAIWTSRAVELLRSCQEQVASRSPVDEALLRLSVQVTDCNAAVFDAANNFQGCVPGIHEVLRRQGLLAGNWCLDEHEVLGRGQAAAIDRVWHAYPHLNDNAFVTENLDRWLSE